MALGVTSNIPSLIGQRTFLEAGSRLNRTLVSLSTGLRINRGADDPAGMIAASALRSELEALDAASRNAQRASSVVSVADAGLSEVGGLLAELDGLVVQASNSAGMSEAEMDAVQLEVDSILGSIDRIAGTTSFGGQALIDGRRAHEVSDVGAGVDSVDVYASDLAPSASMNVDVTVTEAAEQAGLVLSFAGAALDLGGPGATDGAGQTFDVTIQGARGDVSLSFASGTTLGDFVDIINEHGAQTGVEARVSGTSVVLTGDSLGSDSFVSVQVTDDASISAGAGAGVYAFDDINAGSVDAGSRVDFADASAGVSDSGRDVAGSIAGITASGSGATLTVDTMHLSASVTLSDAPAPPGEASAVSTGTSSAFRVTGGPSFAIGPDVGPGGRVGISLPGARARDLGRIRDDSGETRSLADLRSGGALDLRSGNLDDARRAVRNASSQVARDRARLGSFAGNTVASAVRGLGAAMLMTASALSSIRDTDFGAATSASVRESILVQSSGAALALANAGPGRALSLLGVPAWN